MFIEHLSTVQKEKFYKLLELEHRTGFLPIDSLYFGTYENIVMLIESFDEIVQALREPEQDFRATAGYQRILTMGLGIIDRSTDIFSILMEGEEPLPIGIEFGQSLRDDMLYHRGAVLWVDCEEAVKNYADRLSAMYCADEEGEVNEDTEDCKLEEDNAQQDHHLDM